MLVKADPGDIRRQGTMSHDYDFDHIFPRPQYMHTRDDIARIMGFNKNLGFLLLIGPWEIWMNF